VLDVIYRHRSEIVELVNCNIAYFAVMVFFFEIFCKTTCSTGDIYIYVHFKMLCKVLSWISAFITPELSHHYYRAGVGN